MTDKAACAHLHISYRTEPADGGAPRGWWACDSECGATFLPVPKPRESARVHTGLVLTFAEARRFFFP